MNFKMSNPFDQSLEIAMPVTPPESEPDLHPLTERQAEVMIYVAKGLTNAEIAKILGCAVGTVKNHVANIILRLQVANRTEAASVWALRRMQPVAVSDPHDRPLYADRHIASPARRQYQ